MMQFEITYVLKQPNWKGKPGTLFRPVPRTPKEVGHAVEQILQSNFEQVKEITIRPTDEHKPDA